MVLGTKILSKWANLSERFWLRIAQHVNEHKSEDEGGGAAEKFKLMQAYIEMMQVEIEAMRDWMMAKLVATERSVLELKASRLEQAPGLSHVPNTRVQRAINSVLNVLKDELPGHYHLVIDINSGGSEWGLSGGIPDRKMATRALREALGQALEMFGE